MLMNLKNITCKTQSLLAFLLIIIALLIDSSYCVLLSDKISNKAKTFRDTNLKQFCFVSINSK